MRRFLPIALFTLLASSLVFVGCDSGDDGTPDEDRIVGTWMATSANVSVRPSGSPISISVPVAFTSGDGDITLMFSSNDTFTLRVTGPIIGDPPVGDPVVIVEDGFDETTNGTYSIQSDGQIRFGNEVDVDIDFDGNDEFDLSVENTAEGRAALAFLLGGSVPQEVLDSVEGASITFRRTS